MNEENKEQQWRNGLVSHPGFLTSTGSVTEGERILRGREVGEDKLERRAPPRMEIARDQKGEEITLEGGGSSGLV